MARLNLNAALSSGMPKPITGAGNIHVEVAAVGKTARSQGLFAESKYASEHADGAGHSWPGPNADAVCLMRARSLPQKLITRLMRLR